MKYEIHPFAELFPMMDKEELNELAEDIRANGLRGKITLLDGKILDGRNRYLACGIAEVEPEFCEHNGGDPLTFVLSANLHRRHLNASQRAMVAAGLENMTHGGDRKSDQDANLHLDPVTRSDAAEKLNVSTRAVADAAKIIAKSPKQAKAIRSGKKTIHAVITEEKAQEKPLAQTPLEDEVKQIIPDALIPIWRRRDEIQKLLSACSLIKSALRSACNEQDALWVELTDMQQTQRDIANVWTQLKLAQPYAVCPTCRGKEAKCEDCKNCSGRGMVSQFRWKQTS